MYSTRNASEPWDCGVDLGDTAKQRVYVRLSQGLRRPINADPRETFGDPIDVTGLFTQEGFNISPQHSRTADFDNDGGQELYAYNTDFDPGSVGRYLYAKWNATQGTLALAPANSSWHFLGPSLGRFLDIADANGDGLPDVFLEQHTDGLPEGRFVRLTQPTGVGAATLGPPQQLSATTACAGTPSRHVMDLNGDGKYSMGCAANGGRLVGLPPEDARRVSPWSLFGDVNGDGLQDGIDVSNYDVRVGISTGRGYRPLYVAFEDSERILPEMREPDARYSGLVLVGDYNGDGRSDILVQGGGYGRPPVPGPCGTALGHGPSELPVILLSDGVGFRPWDWNDDQSGLGFRSPFGLARLGSTFPGGGNGSEVRMDIRNRHGRMSWPTTAAGDVDGDGIPELLFLEYTEGPNERLFLRLYSQQRDRGQGGIEGTEISRTGGADDLVVGVRNEHKGTAAEERIRYANVVDENEGPNVLTSRARPASGPSAASSPD